MRRPGRRPALCRPAVGTPAVGTPAVGIALLVLLVSLAGCGTTSADGVATPTTAPWVVGVGGTLTVGIDTAPTGCNPNTAAGDTWANRFVLAPVLPSAFEVNAKDQPVYDSAVISQAELQSTTPQTIVYTINPKAVWSDGTPITATDFVYTWREERGTATPVVSPTPKGQGGGSSGDGGPTAGGQGRGLGAAASASATNAGTPAAGAPLGPTVLPGATGTAGTLMGYRQIKSVTGSNHGQTVTVVFSHHYADWQALFNDLLPAHVLEKTGWSPACSTVDPAVDLSGGPYVIRKVVPGQKVVLTRNPHWWEQRPNLDRIVIETASNPSQLASWLTSGRVDVALPTSFDQRFLERVASSPSLQSQTAQSTTFLQLELSTTSALTSSVTVREAIAHAIDRQQLVNQVVGWADTSIVPAASHLYAESQSSYPNPKPPALQIATQSGSPPTTLPASPTPAQPFPTTADTATTARLLTQAGFVRRANGTWETLEGQPVTFRVAVDTGDVWATRSASILIRQLVAAGITAVTVDEPTATAAGTALSSGSVDAALLPLHATPYSTTAIAWYTQLLGPAGQGGSQDWTNFADFNLDNLLVMASQQLNPVDAAPTYSQADMLLWQDMVALPLFTQPAVVAWSTTIGGVSADLNGPNLLTTVATWGIKVPPTSPRAKGTSGTTSSS